MFWCIIWPLLAAIIGAILGWLLKSLFCNCDDEKKEIENLKAKNNKLQAELDACLKDKKEVSLNVSGSSLKSIDVDSNANFSANTLAVEASEPELVFDADLAKSIFGKKIVADDLKIVEGIGPKISELFQDNGVKTWHQLSTTPIDRCQEILNIGGKRFEIHRPDTWPIQARLAFQGKWEELLKLQDDLDGGKVK